MVSRSGIDFSPCFRPSIKASISPFNPPITVGQGHNWGSANSVLRSEAAKAFRDRLEAGKMRHRRWNAGVQFRRLEVSMKKLILAAVLLAPVMLFGQSAFDGTWVISPQSAQFAGKPLTILLQNGVYQCDSCVPKV